MRLALLCSLLAGCATTSTLAFPIASTDPRSLARAFEQQVSTPTLCFADSRDPIVSVFDRKLDDGLVAALAGGQISAEQWRDCVDTFAQGAAASQVAALDEAIVRGYRALLRNGDFEKDSALQRRLRTMQAFYTRDNRASGTRHADPSLEAELRSALVTQRLGPAARSFAEDFLAFVDLERGVFGGRTIDGSLLDELYAKNDLPTLQRMAAHLPTASIREEANRRIIRLRIAASSFPEVRANAAEVEERVLRTGVNAIDLIHHTPISASLELPFRGLLVKQDLAQQSARLLGYADDQASASPELPLRGALLVRVDGIATPVTLCASQGDVTPCVAPNDVTIGDALGTVDREGVLHFDAHRSTVQVVALGDHKDRVALSVLVGRRPVLTKDLPLTYARPDDLVMTSPIPGGNAPALSVAVDHRDPARFVFTVDDGQQRRIAVVESADLAAFHVMSAGGKGRTGSRGSDGSSGVPGPDCGAGSPGESGGTGGSGGPGGNGGEVTVIVSCGATGCDDEEVALRAVVLSVAGAGGDGGWGGSGGSGGAAGADRAPSTHTDIDGQWIVDQPGCGGGTTGMSGSDGTSGSRGARGHAGHVRFVQR